MVMMISDETGEGKMTVHQILPGIMICFTDMHMEQCMSEFELNSGQKVLCIDQCREGRIEMENQPGIFSIMRENELRVDDRKHHKGMAYYFMVFPLISSHITTKHRWKRSVRSMSRLHQIYK